MATSAQAERVIAQRYRLVSKIGQGGMGSVWRAEHLALGSQVAIKLIDPSVAEHPEVRARFVREAQAAAQLRSPHVVQILDYGVDGDTPFIAMELMEGESLADRLDRVGRISAQETSRIVSEIARALGKAHEAGIVHRDLKPDNVFLVQNDDAEIAKVLDFGVAKQTAFGSESAHMTSTGAVLGTPYYMSPEQAEGLKDLDHRTDIWALSVIAYECMLGVRPFGGETLGGVFLAICAKPKPVPSLVAEVPDGFDAWFEKGTARLLADRFPTARAAAHALRLVCDPARDSVVSPVSKDAPDHERTITSRPPPGGSADPEARTQLPLPGQAAPGSGFGGTSGVSGGAPFGLSTAGVGAISLPIHGGKPRRPFFAAALGGGALLALWVGWSFISSNDVPSELVDAEMETQVTGSDVAAQLPEAVPLQESEPLSPAPSTQESEETASRVSPTPSPEALPRAGAPKVKPAPVPQAAAAPGPATHPAIPARPKTDTRPKSSPRPSPAPVPTIDLGI